MSHNRIKLSLSLSNLVNISSPQLRFISWFFRIFEIHPERSKSTPSVPFLPVSKTDTFQTIIPKLTWEKSGKCRECVGDAKFEVAHSSWLLSLHTDSKTHSLIVVCRWIFFPLFFISFNKIYLSPHRLHRNHFDTYNKHAVLAVFFQHSLSLSSALKVKKLVFNQLFFRIVSIIKRWKLLVKRKSAQNL